MDDVELYARLDQGIVQARDSLEFALRHDPKIGLGRAEKVLLDTLERIRTLRGEGASETGISSF